MGKLQSKLLGNKEVKIVMLGLSCSGKTAILYKLKQGQQLEQVTEYPTATVGFNVEIFQYRNIKFYVQDAGGSDKFRPLWSQYCVGAQGMIFVVDSADQHCVFEAQEALRHITDLEDTRGIPLLIFLNKQDLPKAMNPRELHDQLGLSSIRNRVWRTQASCAITGDGLNAGLDWLISNLSQ